MKLYLLTRDDDDIDYDEAAGYVVAAGNEHQARNLIRIAKEKEGAGGDEGPAPWLDAGQSTCLELGTARQGTAPGIILRDFRAG